jgi:prolyl-tRNA synthetase
LSIERGIEVGHIFYLGTKYSKAMNATFLDVNGKPQAMEMGCYGIGVTRLPAAAIEQNHDAKGMIWPESIAPFVLVICPIGMDRSDEVKTHALALYDKAMGMGWDVILDDRGERPGVMFADWELIGVPHRLVVSDRSIKAGMAEYQHRRDSQATELVLDQVIGFLSEKIKPHLR